MDLPMTVNTAGGGSASDRPSRSGRWREIFGLSCLCFLLPSALGAAESWPSALAQMPLGSNITQLTWSNCVGLMLPALQSNPVVKALIFMPSGTDELYLFRRAKAGLTNTAPSLFDAVSALTNQTMLRAAFRPPLLLIYGAHDVLEPEILIQHQPTAEQLKRARFVPHALYNDRDWDFMEPIVSKSLEVEVRPARGSHDSWHFYRPTFAAWNLDGLETLEAVALTSKTKVTILRKQVLFELDNRGW
jgi:hypothetical protein